MNTLTDRWHAWRNRVLASPGFQRWAAGFPLTRPVARRRASALWDICAGFVYSQVLFAGVELGLFALLRDGPRSVEDIARATDLPEDAANRLLEAAAALRLLQRRGNRRYGLGALGAALLGNPGALAMIRHHTLLYADLRDPVALLRGACPEGPARKTELSGLWAYAARPDAAGLAAADTAAYSDLMAASQPLVAEDILQAVDLRPYGRLLDVGGGDGSFLTQVAHAEPHLRLMLFDVPAVAERARAKLADAGLGERVDVHGGDMRTDPLPQGADIISLVRVMHDHDDAAAMAILRAAHAALPAGGTLLLAEPMAGTPGAGGVEAYFTFYLMAMGSGRPRRAEELARMLGRAGFIRMREVPTRRPMLVRVLTATRDPTMAQHVNRG